MSFEIVQIPVDTGLDNYNYLVRDPASNVTAVVDPSQSDPILDELHRRNWQLDYILSTHHHPDHVGGNRELKQQTGCQVVGYAGDAARIPGIDLQVEEGERFTLGGSVAEILFVPGHTLGHIAYYFPEEEVLFCGDTLFSLGCGRLFEGTPEQMHHSISQLMRLPPETSVYCAHEYTQSNGRFALTLEPGNEALQQRMREVDALRAEGKPTVPSTIAMERASNPFMRTGSPEIRATLGMEDATDVEVFAEIRRRKDRF